MQARKVKYDIIGLTETRRHRPLHAVLDTGEELFLGACDTNGIIIGDFNAKVGPRMKSSTSELTEWNGMSRCAERAVKFRTRSPKTSIIWGLFASLASQWEDPVNDNSIKNTTDSSNILTVVLERQRAYK
ncbi:hypothetical protein V3C99_010405 [Haemonchus contortus]|uniref:Endo/exonuclease/phosphatase domain-containing protein n=1 Tax=Haemonchus contortus TaxID=6289 RepID=A0A7I4YHY8_HAECO